MLDVIIIGSGPAGISAGLYLKRANKNIIIISQTDSALKKAEKIENYYGIKSITGKELYNIGIEQAKKFDIPIKEEEVVAISKNQENDFDIITDKTKYKAKHLILATGTSRIAPKIKGIKEFEGKGISYCAICDAFFYKGKDVAVLGNGNYALHEAEILNQVANSVTILTNGKQMIKNEKSFTIEEAAIKEFKGDNVIKEVEFENNNKIKIDGVFIAIGTAGGANLATNIGALVKNNNVVVNENMETTVKGLYACGDCTGGLLQVSKAVYEGAEAATNIIKNR